MRRLENTDKSRSKYFFSIIRGYVKHFYQCKLSTPKKVQEIQKEASKAMFLYSFKNNLVPTLISLCLLAYSLFISSHAYFLLIFVFAVAILYPFLSDLSFYASYYNAWGAVTRLLLSSKEDGQESDSNLERFQITYNELRKSLKKRIRSSHGNLLTYDYEISRIARDIDTFFDATTKILFKRRVMTIPFSPHDEYDMFLEDAAQSRSADDEWENIEPPPNVYEFEAWKVKDINFQTIDKFLQYFGDIVIRKPRAKAINTVAIGELFRKWNLIVKNINQTEFEESKEDVEKYYDEKHDRRGFLLGKFFNLLVLLMVAVISGVIVSLISSYF